MDASLPFPARNPKRHPMITFIYSMNRPKSLGRVRLKLPLEHVEFLKQEAVKEKTSVSEIIKRSIDYYGGMKIVEAVGFHNLTPLRPFFEGKDGRTIYLSVLPSSDPTGFYPDNFNGESQGWPQP